MSQERAEGVRLVRIDAGSDGQRIDNFLLRELKGVPKSRIYRLLRKGEVRINKGRARADHRLQLGDEVRIPPVRMSEEALVPAAPDTLLQRIEQAILFEDEGLIVVDKPSGLAVHGGSGLSFGLIEALRQMRPDARFLELVHRLDRDTSGLIMVAKKRSALLALHAALRGDGVDKRYLALVVGQWSKRRQKVDVALEKNTLKSGERVVRVSTDGKPALTEFRVVEGFPAATLVEARPITGRTHQIRVHAQFAGHPIAGDEKYCDRDNLLRFRELGLRRLFLHAAELTITWQGRPMTLTAELPSELRQLLEVLRK